MKKILVLTMAFLLLTSMPLWAGHKKSSKEDSGAKKHSHSKSSKSKKSKGSETKGSKGANMDSELKSSDVQFNSKSSSK